ncbi:hypothetical protein KJ652_05525 [Patescibacteria group bacterium]|nr:hypothetical protein [Patescibacteria group bacterium]MBU1124022.1 hypothetical protein [Patescibacteria group bacterium]MBU1911273.1 hypothetical protein [Patescibacteria group bacterium]
MTIHKDLAAGRWNQLTLAEQLGNIGSEISRVLRAKENNNEERYKNALDRALELIDLTINDPKNKHRLREICRVREVVADYFAGNNEYCSSGESLNKYFMYFAISARK